MNEFLRLVSLLPVDIGNLSIKNSGVRQLPGGSGLSLLVPLAFLFAASAWSASFYTQRLEDAKAVTLAPSGGDDTAALQKAVNQVQETTGQGIVLLAPGRYRISNTVYIWPAVRLIGWGEERPVIVLPANTPGFGEASHEKVLVFFAGRRPRNPQSGNGFVPDASPGTFYSALANLDVEIEDGNAGAVAVRARYAQHCFLAHMDFRLGSALAGIHEGGNVVEDVHFLGGTHAVWTSKPSPGWQFTLVDCSFEGQREAAILEREAGLTLIRPRFRHVPTVVEIEPEWADELWVKDARLEDISGPAFIFGMEKNAAQRNQYGRSHLPRRAGLCRVARERQALCRARRDLRGHEFFPRAPLCGHRRRAGDRNALRRRPAGHDAAGGRL